MLILRPKKIQINWIACVISRILEFDACQYSAASFYVLHFWLADIMMTMLIRFIILSFNMIIFGSLIFNIFVISRIILTKDCVKACNGVKLWGPGNAWHETESVDRD